MTIHASATTPCYRDDHTRLYCGDATTVLSHLPESAADCVVTSPPYWRRRDYGPAGQLGQENTLDGYLEHLVTVFRQVHRVLADDGTCWLNLGDSYAGPNPGRLRPKDLTGLPWRVALALQDDGWILRNSIIWTKPNAMPSSARDRLTSRHENIFLLVKRDGYFFDLDPIRVPYTGDRALSRRVHRSANRPHTARGHWPAPDADGEPPGRNPGDVWTIPNRPFKDAHHAVFPIDIPLRAIAAGCRPGGTVIAPFTGSGTTLLAARQLGRRSIGVDISPAYCGIVKERLLHQMLHSQDRGDGDSAGGER